MTHPNSLANLKPDAGLKHGHSTKARRTPTYHTWASIKRRCLNPKDKDYAQYGGRGITICNSWMDFNNFLADMGERPDGTTLDRRNNNSGYNKQNCRWGTPRQQMRNRRDNVYITLNGVTKLRRLWVEEFGLKITTVTSRLASGWSEVDAIMTPVRRKHEKTKG